MKADSQPSASAENEALRWAVDFFHTCAGHLKRDASKQHFSEFLIVYLATLHDSRKSDFDDELTYYIGAAREEPHATAILCKFAALLMWRGDQLPRRLQEFIMKFLFNQGVDAKRKRGPDKFALIHRNVLVGFAIVKVTKTWGLSPTRNAATRDTEKRASAASIVRQGLIDGAHIRMSEDAINDIWGSSPWGVAASLASADLRDSRQLTALLGRLKKLTYSLTGIRYVPQTRRKN